MPTYLKPTETDTLHLPSDSAFEVRMKALATFGDTNAAQSAMLKIDSANPGAISEMEWGAYVKALTVSMIVEWNLTDDNGAPLPITGANLDDLKPEDGQFLATEAHKRSTQGSVTNG